jgi:predicted small metal-binding protein
MVDIRANPDYKSSSPFGAEEHYREFTCREEYGGKECGFQVRAKTDDEVIEHAHMHQSLTHGVKEISPDLEKKIKEHIKVVPIKIGDSRVAKKKSILDTCL